MVPANKATRILSLVARRRVAVGQQQQWRGLSSSQPPPHKSLLRFDMMTGTWVVYSSGRKNRPHQTESSPTKIHLAQLPRTVAACPFCKGNEHLTPTAKLFHNEMRVVPNLYPAVAPLRVEEKHEHHMPFLLNDGFLTNNEVPAVGFHEVVIESPYHNDHIATSPDNHMARDLLQVFRYRGREHREYEDIEHTVYFKNHGSTAGASLIHPHSQIVSTPVVPVEAERLQSLAWQYFKTHRTNMYQRILEEELALHNNQHPTEEAAVVGQPRRGKSRVVEVSDNFVALVPFASPGPYVILILPNFHASGLEQQAQYGAGVDSSDFTTMSDDLIEECAAVLKSCLHRLHVHCREPDFNLVVQTAPVPKRGVQAALHSAAIFRWHIRITPRLGAGAMAGFELGSGLFSNSNMPEEDAQELRDVAPLMKDQ